MHLRIAAFLACVSTAVPSYAQISSLTRREAVQGALERGPRLAVARADTSVANAAYIGARAFPNPTFNAGRSQATPQYHFTFDVPIELPSIRGLRVRSAQVGLHAANLRYEFARVLVALDADTIYTHALAAREHLALSRRTALDADSLLRMVQRRRDAGDASEMEVVLARIVAGQQANVAAADSITYISSILDLQFLLGTTNDLLPIDSLAEPPTTVAPTLTLNEAAASLSVESAMLATRFQHRSIFSTPSINLGVEYGDPTHSEPGMLPVFGVGIPLPLFDRNRGGIAQAEAEQARATAELTLARVEARNEITRATRERAAAMARVARNRQLVASANTVAAMALTAYREGASSLPNVLEAQRTAREVLAAYIDDLASAWIATAQLRALGTPVPAGTAGTQPSPGSPP
jgi:cobalt-zinc-cadmium efflux system outer membrane protein